MQVNGKLTLAQVGEKGRIRVEYDARPVGGERVRLEAFRFLPGGEVRRVKHWETDDARGTLQIDSGELEIGIYALTATALDLLGEPLAGPSIPVSIEYGGWKAWRGLQGEEDLRGEPPPFAGVGGSFPPPGADPHLHLEPPTAVLRPGQEVEFQALLEGVPEGEEVDWELEGEGDLQVLPGNRARFRAPSTEGNRVVRLRAAGRVHSWLQGRATLIVTPSTIASPGKLPEEDRR